MRLVRQVFQDRGVSEDSPEAAQQTLRLRYMRYLKGLRIRFASPQEEAQSGVRDQV